MDTKTTFVSVHAADTLPFSPRKHRPCAYVVNTDDKTESGEHWVAFYFEKRGKPAEYFDSYGLSPKLGGTDFERFLLNGANGYIRNTCLIQHPFSTTCGQHVIRFILQKCRNHTMKDIMTTFCEQNLRENDRLVTDFVAKNFGKTTKVFNLDFFTRPFNR